MRTIPEIKEAISSGKIIYSDFTVRFPDGHAIGGVVASDENRLAEIIYKCLLREDFSANF